jgi:hypothetical protein
MITQSRKVAKRRRDIPSPSPWVFKGRSPWLSLGLEFVDYSVEIVTVEPDIAANADDWKLFSEY